MSQLRNRHLLLLDAISLTLAAWLAFAIRFEGTTWPAGMAGVFAAYVALAVPAKLGGMVWIGLYRRLWRYASVGDLTFLARAVLIAGLTGIAVGVALVPVLPLEYRRVPLSVLALDSLLGAALIAGTRILVRMRLARRRHPEGTVLRRVLIVGAGAAGSLIARELRENRQLGAVPVAFLDDDPSKHHRRLLDIEVLGPVADLPRIAKHTGADEIIIAMPSVSGRVVREIVRKAVDVGLPTRTVPGLFELIDGRKAVSALRKVEIEDLLRREPVQTDLVRVRALAQGKRVLVTGAGGSIGAELCRQIARLEPERLIAVGRGENSVFELLQELHHAFPALAIEPVIADVRDAVRMERVFRTHRPSTVFHAAAHKHVPLMEHNIGEAVLNNVLGTQIVGELSARFGAERCVLISSDKAVRPSSVMGATKRLAEGVFQDLSDRATGCAFVSVRFGNVLGSRGSVVPTFLRQIQAGGPLTITHPEMRRYFMTIPEAVQLVLQAGAMGSGGEVFVLDMGEPIKVVDLARDLIRLSGLEEGHDIEIRFSGIRPGEKLYEELFFSAETASPTSHPKVLRSQNARMAFDPDFSIAELVAMAWRNVPPDELRRGIKRLVPEYSGVPDEPAPPAEEPTTPRLVSV